MAGDTFFPVTGRYRISDTFGTRGGRHGGIDIATYGRTNPVVAPRDLRITRADRTSTGGYGQVIYGVDNQGIEHRFGHLSAMNVSAGQTVSAGSQIGNVGSTGRSTGNHLHYETRQGGKAINPQSVLSGAKSLAKAGISKGIDAAKKAAGEAVKGALMSNPVTAPIAIGAEVLGIGGDGCGPICQLQKWIKESAFFQRIALALLAFIVIFAGFYLLKGNMVQSVARKALA